MQALNDSGYLMEQEVASTLEGLGYGVQANCPFEDIDEGKSREMDVRAVRSIARNEERRVAALFEIIVECKNSANPFVFIGRPKTVGDDLYSPDEYRFFIPEYEASKQAENRTRRVQLTPAFRHRGFNKVHYAYKRPEKAVQFCRIDRKGAAWHANHAGLYDAIFYPMAKAVESRRKQVKSFPDALGWRYMCFFVPLVVVSGDIFWVDSGVSAPTPEARSYVTFRRQLMSKNLSGAFTLDFVRQDYLAQFVEQCLGPIAALASELVLDRSDFLCKQAIPWDPIARHGRRTRIRGTAY